MQGPLTVSTPLNADKKAKEQLGHHSSICMDLLRLVAMLDIRLRL